MYKGMKAPAKNKNGLIIPPTPVELSPDQAEQKGRKSLPDRHHIYFPRVSFVESGELAFKFREHRFNSIWLPRFQHERLHRRYDTLVREYPSYMMPDEDVMATFIDEAKILDDLNVNVRAIDMIDSAIYEGRVRKMNKTQEHRDERVQKVSEHLGKLNEFAVMPRYIRKPFLEMGRICLQVAA
jgi:hypothetical protein